MIIFCQIFFWSLIKILLKSLEILRKSYGTNLIWWMFCQDGERVWRQQSCPLGKICLENSLKLWMWAKNTAMPLSTQDISFAATNQKYVFFEEFFGFFLAPRLFTFLGLSCFHRLLTNFPFLPRIKGTFSHLKSFSNFAVIFNGFE